jgi:hypothetical protein
MFCKIIKKIAKKEKNYVSLKYFYEFMKNYLSTLIIWDKKTSEITCFIAEQEPKILQGSYLQIAGILNALAKDGWQIKTHAIQEEQHFWTLQILNESKE